MALVGKISVGDGATFTPHVSASGVLSFTNNKGLPNPEPFDLPAAVLAQAITQGLATLANLSTHNTDSDAHQDIRTILGGKVDKVAGMGLSANSYTTAEKNKLSGIATNANNYTLPAASASTLGGIRVGANLHISNGILSAQDTTYAPFLGATPAANGAGGLVPAPSKAEADMVLGAHGGWRRLPRDYELPVATSDTLGGIKIGNFFGLDEENRLILHGLAEYLASIVPVGTILPYAAELSIPNGFLPCNGAEVKEEDYPELYEAIGTRYGFANAPDKFCLPNLGDSRFMQFEDIGVGSQVAAGLPNITGHAEEIYLTDIYNESTLSSSAYADGAFEWVQGTHFNKNSDSGGAGYGKALSFSASRSNAIYGRSNTVQPKALTLRAIIKY